MIYKILTRNLLKALKKNLKWRIRYMNLGGHRHPKLMAECNPRTGGNIIKEDICQ